MDTNAQSIQDRVKTYEDACGIKGITPLTIENFSFLPADQQKLSFAHHKVVTIADVLNEGWVPDWNNNDEWKYFPWFDMETYGDAPAGSGFAYYVFGCSFSGTDVGARLCFKSAELAKYAGTQFLEIYRDLMK